MNNDCIFCKIVAKTVPSDIVYEDDTFLGFLTISPISKGHTLLIPKNHHIWMHEAPDEIVSDIFLLSKKLMIRMKEAFACDYIEIQVAGELVLHFHVHLFPRWIDDNIKLYETVSYATDKEKQEYANKIKNSL